MATLAAYRDVVWAQHLTDRARRVQEHELRYLFVEVTRRCNLACAYCGSSCGPRERPSELSIDEWVATLRQIAADFDPRRVMVAVTGGEPLMKEGVFGLFAELRRLGFPYGMVSNGTQLDRATAARLIEVGIGSISLSMDAPPVLNDSLRGAGTSDAVTRAVEALREVGYEGKLEIISTITRPAVALLPQMREWVANLRVPLWRVAPVMPIGRAARRPDLVPGPTEIRAILEFILAARQDGFLPRPEMSEEGYLGNRFEGNVRPYLCQCRAGTNIAGILCDGRIGACPELGEAYIQGHVKEDRFSEVWRDGYRSLRDRSWMKQGQCAECAEFPRCEGGALHLYEFPGAGPLRCLYLLAREGGG
ncbi:MAG: radical SAM protein [Polyangiaceae bacterium]|nr:radical SAM protein [Polyangiaceae bacterium]